ncbi:hypothetical protein DFQ03_1589 [Maribacter caenipelagi]|uniref:Uncharacterized protein n=1 Tax=Maribacter caenipelagi TaxID=1447781 RepID=A0A4R7DD72_9FLAO|nr:hypothetical protein [Maribacter caenipelagi]TDS17096.1 hypothetical protein DFQ03_1589 [Maribacter caenipelagi]
MLEAIFLFITLLTLSLFYIGTGKDLRLVLIFIVWQLLIGLLSYFEVFKEKPQLFPMAIVATILLSVLCLRMITVSKLKRNFLIGIHIVRIPVELCLYALYIESQVPEIMTFSGWNFDVLIGISAGTIFIYELVKNNTVARKSFIVWNYIGLLFLSFIVIIAILSSPLPIQQFAFEQPNVALFQFPYCFLPTCIVPLVYLSHILLIKDTINYNSQK